jgi:phage tail P2-like protein
VSLLPASTSPLERNVAQALGSISDLPTPLRTLWDPQAIPADLLPYLAWALSVEEEWEFATTEQEQRDLVESSVALHSYKGTPYAVRQGLRSAGFRQAEIHEGQAVLRHDGSFQRNGIEDYNAGRRWALFSITLDLGNSKGFSGDIAARARRAIDTWKNARSHLYRIDLRVTLSTERDGMAEDTAQLHVALHAKSYRTGIRDGTHRRAVPTRYLHDGARTYAARMPRAGKTTWEGLAFGAPRTRRHLGIHFALESRRDPGLPRDGSIRFDARFARDYRGAIDPTPPMHRITLEDARAPSAPLPGFLINPDPDAWAESRPLDGPLYGMAVRQHPRDGTVLRNGARIFGPDEMTYYTQQGQTVFQTVWDYDQTQWDYDTTEWDE